MSIIDSKDPFFRRFRQAFPILRKNIKYFDSAATALKPLPVINAMDAYYRQYSANVHRGNYAWAREATAAYEQAREEVAAYLQALSSELVITSGATEAINIVARGIEHLIKAGDTIVITEQEHHANFVPWVWLAERTNAQLTVVPVDSNGSINANAMRQALATKPAVFAVTAISNVVGELNPIEEWVTAARANGAICLIDGAQHVLGLKQPVVSLGAQFYVFSGHKAFADTGVGILWGEFEWLSRLVPTYGGGEMISSVSAEKIDLKPAPTRLEPGTPPIAQMISLGAALTWWAQQDRNQFDAHKLALANYLIHEVSSIDGFDILGGEYENQGVVTLIPTQINAQDWSHWLDLNDIAVRVGQHCAQPLSNAVGCNSLLRISLAPFNTKEEVDALIALLKSSITSERVDNTPITWADIAQVDAKQQMQRIVQSARVAPPTHYYQADKIDGCEATTYVTRDDGHWHGWSESAVIDGVLQLVLREANSGAGVTAIEQQIKHAGLDRWLSRTRRNGIDAVLTKLG